LNEGLSTKDAKKLKKASILATSDDPKDWDSARARQTDVDYKDLVRQLKAKKKKKIKEQNELAGKFKIDTPAHNKAKKKAKLRNLARGNENPAEKKAAERKAGGPKLYGEGRTWDSWKKAAASALKRKKEEKKAQPATDAGARARRKLKDKEHNKYVNFLHADDD
jgi:hypothetical protein